MNVGCVTRHNYPTAQEIRITKFGDALRDDRNSFLVYCPGRAEQATREDCPVGTVVRLRPRSGAWQWRLVVAPIPVNPVWFIWLFRQFRAASLDVVIVRDLRLALPTFFAARLCGIKTILDLGEHYPGMMEILGKQALHHHLIRHRWLIEHLEIWSVQLADSVWVVVEENRERLSRYSSRIEVVSNFPSQVADSELKVCQRRYTQSGQPVTVISLGLIDNIRGLDLAIDAFALLIRELPNSRLVIFGDGFYRAALEMKVAALNLQQKIVFGGWVDEQSKYQKLSLGDVGLILHKVCELTQHTVPNKLFDYMSVGLPIMATHLRPVEGILERERCGVVVDEDALAIAQALRSLILDADMRQRFAENGYKAVRTHYNWASEAEKVVREVSALARERRDLN